MGYTEMRKLHSQDSVLGKAPHSCNASASSVDKESFFSVVLHSAISNGLSMG